MLIKVYIISKYGVNMAHISVFKVYEGYVYMYKAYIRFSDIMCNIRRTKVYMHANTFNFNGQSSKLADECGPTISDHTKQHCRNKRSMITPEA